MSGGGFGFVRIARVKEEPREGETTARPRRKSRGETVVTPTLLRLQAADTHRFLPSTFLEQKCLIVFRERVKRELE